MGANECNTVQRKHWHEPRPLALRACLSCIPHRRCNMPMLDRVQRDRRSVPPLFLPLPVFSPVTETRSAGCKNRPSNFFLGRVKSHLTLVAVLRARFQNAKAEKMVGCGVERGEKRTAAEKSTCGTFGRLPHGPAAPPLLARTEVGAGFRFSIVRC